MRYQVEYTPQAVNDLRALSPTVRSLLYGWIEKNLVDCEDPRRHGSGDSDGGRWRYRVGEYRLLAEIQDGRIVILAVLSGLRRTGKAAASPNVFLRSTLRQPVKTALLLAVMALITFAFVSRVAEYLLVKQETERLGSYYRSVGTLQSATGDKWADTTEALAYLEDNASVQTVQMVEYTSAVIQDDIYNADVGTENTLNGICVAFYGTLQNWDATNFYFTVDKVLAGYPEHISEGGSIVLFREYSYGPQDVEYAYEQLEKGGRYLAAGFYASPIVAPGCRVVESDDGTERVMHAEVSCASDELFFIPVSEGTETDWSGLKNHRHGEDILLNWDEQRALNIIPTKDMSALPIVLDSASGICLTDGRWLDSTDDELGKTVCVINEELASRRGLQVGDTLTLKLRDIPSHLGVFVRDSSKIQYPAAFLERIPTKTDTYEIVGIYGYISQYNTTYVNNYTYVPASVVPDSFAMTTPERLDKTAWGTELLDSYIEGAGGSYEALPHPRDISFVLASPDAASQFLSETREDLSAMGWEVTMLESNWENFQAAAQPMVRSSLMNVIIFSALLLVTFCLLAVVYYRMRRKEVAIARALGVPSRCCAYGVSTPLLLLGILGIAAGAYLGWQYTLGNAAGTLSALSDLGEEVLPSLPLRWLAVLGGAALALLIAVTLGGAVYLTGRPVLALVQDSALTARKESSVQAAAAPAPDAPPLITTTPIQRIEPPAAAGNTGAAHILHFTLRHITRAKLKSGLSVVLAAGFTVGLAAIRLSIAGSQDRMDWLYENTAVEAELLLADAAQEIQGGGFLRQDTIDALLDSGYVTDAYLEGSAKGAVIRYTPGMEDNQGLYISEEDMVKKTVRAFADESVFLSPAGSGGAVAITYLDGWDGSLFAQEWTADKFPIVLPKSVYASFGSTAGLSCKGFRVCEVAGYYEGEVAGSTGETDPVLIPLSAYQGMGTIRSVTYGKVHVTLAPSLNREPDRLTQIINDISASQGTGNVALRAVIWDEELRMAVAPLENSIELMRVLYPVTLALSLLVAAGIAVLFVMTSAKEAAIMRVLGTSRLRSCIMLALQTAFTSAAGLFLALLGILFYAGRSQPGLLGLSVLCAALYLLAALFGSAASASVLTGRNPLELLQVKE